MQSYIGVLDRERAKVSFKLWRDVPQEVKNTIWDSIKLTFNVDDQWKKGCMESANTKWHQWKTYLYNKYIVPFENKPHMLYCPPPDSGILAKDWKNFVMSRLSIEFQMDELTGMMKWTEQCCGSEHVQIKIGSLRVNF